MSHGVTFWTEGGSPIGMGHLSRCVNIARALKRLHIPFNFLVNDEKSVKGRLEAEGFDFRTASIAEGSASAVTEEVVVIDTKKDLKRLAGLLKEAGKKVVAIDNTTAPEADSVVVPSAFFRGGKGNRVAGGSEFLIIGENFLRERKTLFIKEGLNPFKVLVTMGGADPFNLTELVVNALERLAGIEVTVVTGPASAPSPYLRRFMETRNPAFRFLYDVADMAPLMSSCHIAFTAVGTTIYELAYMGVPSVIISNYPGDDRDMRELKDLGISFGLGYFKDVTAPMIRGAVKSLMKRASLLDLMSRKAYSLTDGRGALRIAHIIAALAAKDAGTAKREALDEVRHA